MLFASSKDARLDWFFPALITLLILIGIGSSYYVYNSVTENNSESLISRAETIAYSLDTGAILALEGSEADVENPIYQNLKEKMIAIRDANPDSQFIYLMGQNENNEIFFYVDSEEADSEDYSPPGQVYYEESPAIELGFSGGQASVEGPTTDRWGTWITGIAPIFDSEGKVAAIAGIDIDAGSYQKSALLQASIPSLLMLILASFMYFGNKLRQREQELLALKSQFVALATHEVRSPLTGIVWSLKEFLKQDNIHTEELAPVEKAASHLIDSVNDILYSFSLETTRVKHDKVYLESVVEKSLMSLKSFRDRKGIQISKPDLTHFIVLGDAAQLEQVITNIISNAIKYSPDGGNVEIKETHTHDVIHITCRDEGIGISEADQKKVFEGFYRGENAKKHAENGTGLGLYISKKIVDNHKGKLWIESEVDKGTTMHIELPLAA